MALDCSGSFSKKIKIFFLAILLPISCVLQPTNKEVIVEVGKTVLSQGYVTVTQFDQFLNACMGEGGQIWEAAQSVSPMVKAWTSNPDDSITSPGFLPDGQTEVMAFISLRNGLALERRAVTVYAPGLVVVIAFFATLPTMASGFSQDSTFGRRVALLIYGCRAMNLFRSQLSVCDVGSVVEGCLVSVLQEAGVSVEDEFGKPDFQKMMADLTKGCQAMHATRSPRLRPMTPPGKGQGFGGWDGLPGSAPVGPGRGMGFSGRFVESGGYAASLEATSAAPSDTEGCGGDESDGYDPAGVGAPSPTLGFVPSASRRCATAYDARRGRAHSGGSRDPRVVGSHPAGVWS